MSPPPTPPEHTVAIIERHRQGDRTALQALFERNYDRVYRLVRIELHGVPIPGREVVDLVQDVFVRVIEGLEGYEARPDAKWISWVATLARNEIVNRRREQGAGKRAPERRATTLHTESGTWEQVAADVSSVVSRVAVAADKERVDTCVPRLPEDQRRVVLLRDYAGYDWSDIAVEMGRSPEACQQLHLRGRMELSRLLRGT